MINVYPIPSVNTLTIKFANQVPEIYHLQVFNIEGKLQYSNKIYSSNSGTYIYNHKLKKGVYLLEISNENRKMVRKFIVE